MGLRDGQGMMVFYTHIWFFSVCFQGQSRLSVCQGQIQHLQAAYPSVRLRGSLSVLTAALFSPGPQVSFCWKSRGCWRRRRWQRRLRVSTAGSLMWSSARPTCSGECLIRTSSFFFFFFFLICDFHSPNTYTETVDVSQSL